MTASSDLRTETTREEKKPQVSRRRKHRRRDLKRELAENPEEAHHSGESFGRHSSEGLNGLDDDATRRGD